jgi:hypothetical protein
MNETRFKKHFPNASRDTVKANAEVRDSIPQQNNASALVGAAKGEEKELGRVVVCFKGYRVRPLDPDNFAGSVKGLLDGLRHAHLIRGDEPWKITLQTEQEKAKSFAEEKTVIEIEYP